MRSGTWKKPAAPAFMLQMLREVSGFPAPGAGSVFDLHERPGPRFTIRKAEEGRGDISYSLQTTSSTGLVH